jgi:hypothetical protein
MTVSQAHVGKTHPGRLDDAVNLAREGAKLVGRHGGQVRFLTPAFAGEATGTTIFAVDYTDEKEFGRSMQEMSTDSELQDFVNRVQRSDSPTTIISDSLTVDVPIGYTPKGGHGALVEVYLSRLVPGRLQAAISMSARVCKFVEGHGAVNARTFQVIYGGSASGLWGVSWEIGDWIKLSQLATAWQSDPEGLEIQTQAMSSATPTNYVSSAVYQDIPL